MHTNNSKLFESVGSWLTSYYSDDPNPETAGQGMAYAPFIFQTADSALIKYWMMAPAEQLAVVYLLERLRPKVAVEIGTRYGGSLQILSKLCDKVYSLDIDPKVPERLAGAFSNVEYIVGPSTESLPPLLDQLSRQQAELSFVLVDGDHSAEGVRNDIDILLKYTPIVPMVILMHDSFNPECRQGLRSANWSGSPNVQLVELDFVSGVVNPSPSFRGQLWGGLALGYLEPRPRTHRFEVTARAELTYQKASTADVHKSPYRRFRTAIRQTLHKLKA